MYNRYQGNTGRVVRVDDRPAAERQNGGPVPAGSRPHQSPHQGQSPGRNPPHDPGHGQPNRPGKPAPPRQPGLMEQLGQLGQIIPNSLGQMETEDVILLLILYLMYRESGDSELLMIMGGMFLL